MMKRNFLIYLFTLWTAFVICATIDGIWGVNRLMAACGLVLSLALIKPIKRLGGETQNMRQAVVLLLSLVSGSIWLACVFNGI